MDKMRVDKLPPNMETTLETLTDIISETLEGVTGEPMTHLVIAIPKDPGKTKSLKKIILAGNMPPGLAREILEISREHIGDNPQESAVVESKDEVCSHCGQDHDEHDGMVEKLEKFKPLLATLIELRETKGGKEFLSFFTENSDSMDGKEKIIQSVMEGPEDALGKLKRKFLSKYMSISMGVPEKDLEAMVTH